MRKIFFAAAAASFAYIGLAFAPAPVSFSTVALAQHFQRPGCVNRWGQRVQCPRPHINYHGGHVQPRPVMRHGSYHGGQPSRGAMQFQTSGSRTTLRARTRTTVTPGQFLGSLYTNRRTGERVWVPAR